MSIQERLEKKTGVASNAQLSEIKLTKSQASKSTTAGKKLTTEDFIRTRCEMTAKMDIPIYQSSADDIVIDLSKRTK
jgi:hypothetical protein